MGRGDDFLPFDVEGSLARSLEPDPWSVLAPRATTPPMGPSRIGWRGVALLALLAVVGGASAGAVAGRARRPQTATPSVPASALAAPPQLGGLPDLVEQVTPSVVYLSTRVAGLSEELGPHPDGTLTGFIVDDRGYIVTARRGIDKVSELQVVLYDGRRFRGRVVHESPDNDMAVVKIDDAVGLEPVRLGRSADLRVGEPIVVVGNAFSYGGEVSVGQGVVTALHRKILVDNLDGLLQTSAPVGAAKEGGPAFDLAGRVVGLSVMAPSDPGESYVIGIDSVKPFVDQIVQRRAPLSSGVKVATLTPDLAFGIGIAYTRGVIVVDVRQGGPGEQATLQPNDVITAINGEPVDSEERFLRLTVAGPPEPTVTLTVLRGHDTLSLALPLAPVGA